MQHDLFPPSAFSITPETGRSEPPLWVRRLVIWREPGHIIRDISLKPGFNIIWSPDSGGSEVGQIGHGGGKTTFCRLLRYCLGEDSFAPDGQRRRIWDRFPKGHVGVEVVLRGRSWIVVRALGDRRHDVVIEGGSLDDAFRADVSPTGMQPLREAITRTIVGDAALLMPAAIGEAGAWEAVLAWAARDQECRFGHHLEWRDPETDSRSPVRGRSRDDHLTVVRALIGALSADEIATRHIEEAEGNTFKERRRELERLDWQIGRMRAGLAEAFGGSAGPGAGSDLDAAGFRAAAAERLARILKLADKGMTIDLARARHDRDAVKRDHDRLVAELREIEVRIEEKGGSLAMLRAELPEAHAKLTKENNPICPICKVPIDKALAEGCGISTVTCDLESLKAGIAKRRERIQFEENEIERLKGRKPGLNAEIALVRQRLDQRERNVARLESALSDHSKAIRKAQRLIDDTERLKALLAERSAVEASLGETATRLEKTREALAAHRAAAADTVRLLSERFDAVLRELIPGEIKGEAKLDGNGLTLKVEMCGERSTAAIESLKVIAFDLAALAMTIEGRTRLAGLLIHDSPREADLGRSIYHRLFDFACRLEGFGPAPLFQYVVTTTTEPPEKFRSDPWLRLVVRGAPAQERLMKVDL